MRQSGSRGYEESNNQMAQSEHGEYREELHGEHPHSYDHTEPKYSLLWIIGGMIVGLVIAVGIGVQFYYERTAEATVYRRVLSQDSWQLQDLRRKESRSCPVTAMWIRRRDRFGSRLTRPCGWWCRKRRRTARNIPTNSYPVKTDAQLAVNPTGVSPAGAAAAAGAQTSGVTSSPNVQQPSVPQQPHK